MVLHHLVSFLARPKCAACDALLGSDAVFCAACVVTLEPPPALPALSTASFAYGGAVSETIRSCKYRSRVDRLRALTRLVVERLPRGPFDVVAPIPLHRARLIERGFDQAALLARAVGRRLNVPCDVTLVRRVIDTPRLATLDALGRSSAVMNAFVARPCGGERVLLVDDVRTTGATLGAAADAITARGGVAASHVLAATPRA